MVADALRRARSRTSSRSSSPAARTPPRSTTCSRLLVRGRPRRCRWSRRCWSPRPGRNRDDDAARRTATCISYCNCGDGAVGRPGRARRRPTARWVVAGLDRNGLRPMRYVAHRRRAADRRLRGRHGAAGRERRSSRRAALGPGQMHRRRSWASRQLYHDRELKDHAGGAAALRRLDRRASPTSTTLIKPARRAADAFRAATSCAAARSPSG